MKSIGKIVVMFISLFVLSAIFWFISLENGGEGISAIGLFITIGFSWFISYSKWANENIWNPKIATPINNSSNEPEEIEETVEESLNDNKNILGDINLPTLANLKDSKEEILQKIEELKRQIEVLEESLNDNEPVQEIDKDTNSSLNKQDSELYPNGQVYIIALIIVLLFLFLIANSSNY